MNLPFKYPTNATVLPLHSIQHDGREREDYGDLQSLSDEIVAHGLIHPPTVWKRGEDDYVLLAGGRRTASMKMLGCTHIPCSVRDEPLQDYELLEIELVENTGRLNFSWQEEVKLIAKAHSMYKKHNVEVKGWGVKHTGKLLKRSAAHVSHALVVAQAITTGNEAVAKAESINDAYRILLKQREDYANQVAATRIKSKIAVAPPPKLPATSALPTVPMGAVKDAASLDDVFDLSMTPEEDDFLMPRKAPIGAPVVTNFFNGMTEFPLSKWFLHGDCYEIMESMPEGSVDHILTDPPYGIDIHEGFFVDKTDVEAQHDREENIADFPRMMKCFWRILKQDSYCIMFFDYEHYELLVTLAKQVGFKVQIHPCIWHKTHTCKNTAPNINFTKNHEPALVLKKGAPRLHSSGIPSLISANGQLERHLYSHPFSKPFEMWQHFIKAIAKPGDVVCDPFAGQGSCPRALINLGITPLAMESVRNHYDRCLVNVSDLIKELTQGNATFV
jgi:site-specific DNA-methyltransferase (adenine-specific)